MLHSKFLFLLICLCSGTSSAPYDAAEGKVEKLQIEGTVLNVDEWNHPRHRPEKAKYDDYWAQINWGPRASPEWQDSVGAAPTQPPRYAQALQSSETNSPLAKRRMGWRKEANLDRHDHEQRQPVVSAAQEEVVSINPEAELIDPSKVSEQLANLKFMRYEKQIKKDI